MLWLVLLLALTATCAYADKVPAVMDGTRWRINGTTRTNPIVGCDAEYTQVILLEEGTAATLTFSGVARFTVNGLKLPDGGDVSISMDNGPQLIYDSKQDAAGCNNYGSVNVQDPSNEHQIRVFVPVQDGTVVFGLLGADLAMLADETLITDDSPSPTPPGQSSPSTTSTTPPTTTAPPTTSSRSTTSLPTESTLPPPTSTGLSTGAIVGIGVTIPVVLSLVGVFAFIFWRRRRDSQKAAEAATGRPTPYGLEAGGRPSAGARSPATTTTNTADTKLRGAFLGARGGEKDPRAYHVGDASGSDEPFSSSTGSSGAKRAVYARRGDGPNQLPPGAAAPSTPSMSMSGHVTSSGSPTSGSPQLSADGSAPQPEPEMRELYQAMHQAGFTVNTLFDRLRRDGTTRRRGERGTEVGTMVPQSAVGEPLPRYE